MIFVVTQIALINQSLAGQAMIKVFKAPIFSKPDIQSRVLLYYNKGDEIYIHPKEFNRNDLLSEHEFVISEEKLSKEKMLYDEKFKDRLFQTSQKNISDLFYITVDNLGRDAYVLKDHVHLKFNDSRESQFLSQSQSQTQINDKTDYRPLSQELPDDYPFLKEGEARGQFQLGFSRSFRQSYPYDEKVNDQGLGLETEFIFNWAHDVKWDKQKRLFFGGNIVIGFHENNFALENFTASEKVFRIGVGPYLSYDMWRDKKYCFNISIAIPVNFVNTKDINFKELNTNTKIDSQYQAFNIEPHIGSSFQIKNMFNGMDLILGFNTIAVLPFSYQLIDSSSETGVVPSSFRKKVINESFQLISNFFIGFQTIY